MNFPKSLAKSAEEVGFFMERLLAAHASPAPRLMDAMRYATLGPGKRLRPYLLLESAALFNVPRAQAMRAAAALEFVHCYSLVHDDLPAMDDDDLRRGRPTVHRAFDEATAILAGDALLTLAFEVLGHEETSPDAALRSGLVLSLAQAAGHAGMAGGQMLDLGGKAGLGSGEQAILEMQGLKTGALFRFACEAGAILGRADEAQRAALTRFAGDAGLAFQIADDILDAEANTADIGKTAGKDRAQGKATFVDLYGLDGAKRRCGELVERATAELAPFGDRAAALAAAARFMIERRS